MPFWPFCTKKATKIVRCKIVLLDETELIQEIKSCQKGQDLLDIVFKHLNLLETVYFGLQYVNGKGLNVWLQSDVTVMKQVKGIEPLTFQFAVRFYAADPCKLLEESTRYQFFLQIKRDIQKSRLQVASELGAQLLAFVIQSELGDFDPATHRVGYVSEFHFLPEQTLDFENKVAELHKKLIGQVPAAVELQFLEKVKWLDLYGCELYSVIAEDSNEYYLGLSPHGIIVMKNRLKVANYFWPRVVKPYRKGKFFMLRVIDAKNEQNTYGFEMASTDAVKVVEFNCKEQLDFFRLSQKSDPNVCNSKYYTNSLPRPSSTLVRIPSRRYQRQMAQQIQQQHHQQEQARIQRFNSTPSLSKTVAAGQGGGSSNGGQHYQNNLLATAERRLAAHSQFANGSASHVQRVYSKSASASPISVRAPFLSSYDFSRDNCASYIKRNLSQQSLSGNATKHGHSRQSRLSDNESEVSKCSRYSSRSRQQRRQRRPDADSEVGTQSEVGAGRQRRRQRRHRTNYEQPAMVEWNQITERHFQLPASVRRQAGHRIEPIDSSGMTEQEKHEIRFTAVESDTRLYKMRENGVGVDGGAVTYKLERVKGYEPEPYYYSNGTAPSQKHQTTMSQTGRNHNYRPPFVESGNFVSYDGTLHSSSKHQQLNSITSVDYQSSYHSKSDSTGTTSAGSSSGASHQHMLNGAVTPRVTFQTPHHTTAYYNRHELNNAGLPNSSDLTSMGVGNGNFVSGPGSGNYLSGGGGIIGNGVINNGGTNISGAYISRRRSSLFPQYLRRKSVGGRKDSTFASESTKKLYPFQVDDKQPDPSKYGASEPSSDSAFKFGWVNGVYIRTVLNIWGVMLFLRMGWITGQAGIVLSLGIIFLSTLVTICTALSMSAICTNGEVGTGGIYYMISRSLGAEAGSMIGVVFSFANAVLVSLNLVGAAETTVEILRVYADFTLINELNDTRIYGLALLIFVAIIPLIGMDWEAKAMFVLLVILLTAIGNYIIGTFIPVSHEQISKGMVGWGTKVIESNLWPKFASASFSEIFSVFFPSVIGIFAGASMSGDLRNPNEAIPKGTFLAIMTTSTTYAVLVIFLGFTVLPFASGVFDEMNGIAEPLKLGCIENNTCKYGLLNEYNTMGLSSAFMPLIYAGIYAATISSALGSYVCSPRIFQALCEDKLFPHIEYFAKGYGQNNDPRRGYILTFLIAAVFILMGELNAIAPIISNFFMASFCLVNVACFHASFVGSPSFRPTFKYYNQWISLVTGVSCIGIMFYLDYISASATVFIMGLIYLYISHKNPDVNWGSSTRDHVYNNALFSAIKLNYDRDHVKNFRPSILLLTGNPSARIPLVEFTNNITKNRSLLLIGHIINEDISNATRERVINVQYDWMLKRKIKGFYVLLECKSLAEGTKILLQTSGLGQKLSPKIVMMGYKSSWRDCIVEDLVDYYNVLITALEMHTGICILRVQEGLDFADLLDGEIHDHDVSTSEDYHVNSYNVTPNAASVNRAFTFDDTVSAKVRFEDTEMDENQFRQMTVDNTQLNRSKLPAKPQCTVVMDPNAEKAMRLQKIKTLLPGDAIDAINQFNEKQKAGPIDIWWLTDDGGLTVLIPYLLNINYLWSDCYIRLFCVAKTVEQKEEMHQNMVNFLESLRIPVKEVCVVSEQDLDLSDRSKQRFRTFINDFMNKSDLSPQVAITKSDLDKFEMKTSKYLKIRDQLLLHSKESTLIVMTLPMPHKEIPPSIFMAWLETITEEMPPFVFVRGNKNVIST